MSRPTLPPSGICNQNPDRKDCPLTCKYNHFESDEEDLTIDAWELKCLDCGWRDTIGFRSDEPDPDAADDFDPAICPFCKISGLKPGKNPCDSCDK
jgi:hypothetical protein